MVVFASSNWVWISFVVFNVESETQIREYERKHPERLSQFEVTDRSDASQSSCPWHEVIEGSELPNQVENGIGIKPVVSNVKVRCSLQVDYGSVSTSEVPSEVIVDDVG